MPRLRRNLFYPTLRGRLGQETTKQERANDAIEDDETEDSAEDLVAEALEEYQEVKALIAALRIMDPGDAQLHAKFAELSEGVEEHWDGGG